MACRFLVWWSGLLGVCLIFGFPCGVGIIQFTVDLEFTEFSACSA